MKLRILRARLSQPAPIGREAVVEAHLGYDTKIDGQLIKLSFDKDPRFIRMDIPGKEYFELIPLTNIATLMVEPIE